MNMYNVNDIRNIFVEKYKNNDFVIDKSGVKTVELLGTSFLANEVSVFGEVNYDWCARELEWYKSMSLNVNDIPEPIPAIWKQVATPKGFINSNYGWCIWSVENGNQYDNVLKQLKSNHDSRRGTMVYTRPTIHDEYDLGGMSDFICTNAVNYYVRNGKLNAVVQMRSNDVVMGYKGDFFFQTHVLNKLATDLGVNSGNIIWNAASLHIYSRHFKFLDTHAGL